MIEGVNLLPLSSWETLNTVYINLQLCPVFDSVELEKPYSSVMEGVTTLRVNAPMMPFWTIGMSGGKVMYTHCNMGGSEVLLGWDRIWDGMWNVRRYIIMDLSRVKNEFNEEASGLSKTHQCNSIPLPHTHLRKHTPTSKPTQGAYSRHVQRMLDLWWLGHLLMISYIDVMFLMGSQKLGIGIDSLTNSWRWRGVWWMSMRMQLNGICMYEPIGRRRLIFSLYYYS